MRRSLTTHISRSHLTIGNNLVDSLRDSVCVIIETEMSQQHGTREEQSSWVSLVLALDVETDVSATWLEDSNVSAHVAAWDDTWASDQGGCDICENT